MTQRRFRKTLYDCGAAPIVRVGTRFNRSQNGHDGRVAQTINPKPNLGAAYAGFACAGLE
jgi:hypothetical protein